ncbi:TPA: G5 domain-containing protein [Streptococcus suis]|nr:ZmpA/ZmpB/ZmpC family metallo-endopeptidase [Streptococcus suis]HEL9629214.1 G5 domain-containing protein [Streptococcus suis]
MKEYRNSIFSIRKLSIGVVSLCIGTGLFLSSLTGLQVEASERIATVDQEIRFHYLLEEELSPEEKSRIVQQLPEDLRQEATYFLVYRPQSPKVLPATGEVISHAAAWFAAGFLVIAVQAIGSKKSRVVSLLYITMAGSALPLLQVDALQSHALAHFNQTVTVKAGDLLPDGKLELTSYDFVGYIVEDGKVDQTVLSEQAVEQVTKQPQILDSSHSNQTVLPEKAPVSEQVQTEETGLQLVTRYREEKIPLEIERLDVEDPNLALGVTRLEAGKAGYRIQRYEEKWLGDQLQSSHLMETQEVAGKPEILYRGTKTTIVQEEVSQVPSASPQATPPVRLDFQLKERVDRQVLPIPEERIETDRLAQGETEAEEGREGLLEITYQDVIVGGQVIASNELHRQETAPISRKVYVGTREKEEVPEPPIETLIPSDNPQTVPPVRLDFQLLERVDRQILPIPEERIETERLAQGETEVEEGREGLLEITYQDVVVGGQIVASNELHRQETSPISRKVYVGTREKEEVPEPPIETLIPSDNPQATPPVRLDFQLKERVDRQVLSIPEERIETDRLAQGETEVEEGREGLLEITYQDVVVGGQIVASNELHRQATSPISRKVYVGTRVDSKGVAPLTHSLPSATLVSEEVAIPFERIESEDPDMAQGTSRIEPGQDGLALVTYADLNGVRTLLTSEEVKPAKSEVTYRGSRVDSKGVAPLMHSLPSAALVSEEVALPFERIESEDPDMAQGTSRVEPGQDGLALVTYADLNGVRTLLTSEVIKPAKSEVTYRGSRVEEVVEEEIPLVERIIGLADQYTDYIWVEQAGYPGRRRRISHNGQVISEEVEPGQERIIHKGLKQIEDSLVEEESRSIAFSTIYQADPELDFGRREEFEGQSGQEVIAITYRTIKGQKTEELGREQIEYTPPVNKVIRVGTKPTEEVIRESLPPRYEADETAPVGQESPVSSGREKVTVYQTTYTVDEETGIVTSHRGQGQIRETGEAPLIRKGTKPTLETHREPLPLIYRADTSLPITSDPVRQEGRDKVITMTTTYILDTLTGEITANEPVREVTDEGAATIVRVGAQPTVREESQSLPTIYRAREDMAPPYQEEVVQGQARRVSYQTNYEVDPQTGVRTPQAEVQSVLDQGRAAEVGVGTKATVETVRESLPVHYQADTSLPITSNPVRQEGRDKVITTTTTYVLDTSSGEVTANEPVREVTDEGAAPIVRVGAQPTVREESQSLPTIYRAREDKEPPYQEEVVQGQARRIRYQTNYVVDPQTGNRTAQEEVQTELTPGRAAEVEVGTKATFVRETIPHRIIRQDDMDLPIGEEIAGPVGQDGSITRITSYRLDERTGLLETLPTIEEVVPAQDQVIRVGTKAREVPPQSLEKPSVSLETQPTGSALVVDEDNASVELHYRVADPDRTLLGLRLEVYHDDQLVKTIDHTHQGLDTDKIQVTDLEHYVPYQARLSFRYQSPDGEREEEVTPATPFDISPKAIELNRVSQRDLFYRNQQGELKQVTGLFQEPADLTGYFVRYQTRDAKEFLWEVQAIQDRGDQFEVSVSLPKLVQARNQADANVLENLDQFQLPKIILAQDSYADFQQLIQAMKARPDGTFKLAADLVASPTSDRAYVENFRGRLEGLDGKTFRILQLTKPLFQNMTGAQIEDILLENVTLEGGDWPTAALAVTATNSQVRNVHVTGRVQSYAGAAGLVYDATASQFESVSFKGQMDLSDHHTSSQITSGGLIGYLRPGSSLRKAYVDLTAQFGPRLSMQDRFGAVVGNAVFSTIDSVFVDGQVEKTTSGGTLAGIGTGGYGVGISNLASALALPEEGFYSGLWTSLPFQLILQEGQATGRTGDNLQISWKSAEEIQQFLRERGLDLLVNPPQSAGSAENLAPSSQPDFHLLRNGREDRKLAYENMSKLLPFYDRHTIVRLGNQLADDSLFVTKSIQSILALKDREVVSDFSDRPDQVNKLLVHFTDQDVQLFDLTYQGAFDQTGVLEYQFGENLLFTPYQWVTGATSSSILSTLRSSFESLDVESEAYAQKTRMDDYLQELRFTRGNPNLVISMKQLYLKHSQQQLKDQLEKELRSLIASQWVTGQPSAAIEGYIQDEIEKHKESIWLALTYLARYYAIDYDRLNIRNLATYHPNFYGQNLSTLDWLKQVGELTYKELAPFAAASNFNKTIGQQVPSAQNLFDYLELNRRLFSPTQTDAAWFKQSSKAFIHEEASASRPDQPVQVYDQLKGHSDYHRYVLPLLNLPEEDQVYLVSLANVLVFGSYGRYVDHQLQQTQPTAYKAKVKEIQEQAIPKHARIWNNYMDFIKSLVSPEARQSIESKLITVREGYNIKDVSGKPLAGTNDRRRWAAEFGDSYRPIDDFFGPTELYYGTFNKSGAADFEFKKYIIYGNADLLTPTGNSTFTHEMTHIFEDQILNLAGRRQGQESESYAMGLLQSIASSNAYYYGFNLTEELDSRASHNSSPSRLTSKEDLKAYLKGSFDTTYFLDALEAEELLKLPKAQQHTVLRKIELELGAAYSQNGQTYRDAHDKIRNLSQEEWQNIQLTKVEDLVTHNLQLANTINNVGTYLRDNDKNYYFVPLYYPIYAGLLNNQGTVGGLQFRRTALELLAEKGWDQGFLPYVSNQLAQEAQVNGRALTDSYIWEKIMPDYQDYASFKKVRYQTSLSQKNAMKPIQIHWNGRQYDLQNGQDIQVLMQVAIQEDLANLGTSFKRQQLKEALYKAFHEVSQEFRESIFLP